MANFLCAYRENKKKKKRTKKMNKDSVDQGLKGFF